MGQQLTTKQRRIRERCISEIREAIVAREASYLTIANWLTIARDEELWLDDDDCECLEDFANKHFDYSKSYVSRLIAAKQAHDDVLELPIGNKNPQKGGEFLAPPKTEAVSRELAKADGPQAKADLWVKANESSKGPPTAAHVAKTRKAMFPPAENNGRTDAQDATPVELPLWQQFAGKHADALNHLTQAMKAINWIEKQGEDSQYIQPVINRIKSDYKQLRGTIYSNTPVGMKGEKVVTRFMERK